MPIMRAVNKKHPSREGCHEGCRATLVHKPGWGTAITVEVVQFSDVFGACTYVVQGI
jgi:hypothetical protein